jgi:hypothetical protein
MPTKTQNQKNKQLIKKLFLSTIHNTEKQL